MFYRTAPKTALQERLAAERTPWGYEPVSLDEDLAPESRPAVMDELLAAARSDRAAERPAFMVELMEAWSQP